MHTDVRPSTLVFGDDRRLRLVDVGLAQVLHDTVGDVTARSMDRAKYSSPEEAQGHAAAAEERRVLAVPHAARSRHRSRAVRGRLDGRHAGQPRRQADAGVGRPRPAGRGVSSAPAGRSADDRYTAAEFGRALVQAAEQMPRPAPLPILANSLFAPDRGGADQPVDPTGPLDPRGACRTGRRGDHRRARRRTATLRGACRGACRSRCRRRRRRADRVPVAGPSLVLPRRRRRCRRCRCQPPGAEPAVPDAAASRPTPCRGRRLRASGRSRTDRAATDRARATDGRPDAETELLPQQPADTELLPKQPVEPSVEPRRRRVRSRRRVPRASADGWSVVAAGSSRCSW